MSLEQFSIFFEVVVTKILKLWLCVTYSRTPGEMTVKHSYIHIPHEFTDAMLEGYTTTLLEYTMFTVEQLFWVESHQMAWMTTEVRMSMKE